MAQRLPVLPRLYTCQKPRKAEKGVCYMTDLATHETPSTLLAISSGQTWFTERQLAALQHMGLKQSTPKGDLAVFLHHCQRTGLDPFAKQIYMIERKGRYTIQTGIDGYRVVGDRVAERRGDTIEHTDPLWRARGGKWQDFWDDDDEPPVAAKYVILKNGHRNVATVMFREFVQRTSDGRPNQMWSTMPCNQLAKCAEVQAWRKVYPNDFAGLVLEGAAQPDTEHHVAAEPVQSQRVTAADILEPEEPAKQQPKPRTKTMHKKLSDTYFALMDDVGLAAPDKREDRLIVTAAIAGRPISSSGDLDDTELDHVITQLRMWQADNRLDTAVTDILNEHALAQENRDVEQ
jgi:phage recombination protein Bet